MQGPCPNCGTQNSTYFGDILTVRGNRDKNTVSCDNCKSQMTFLSTKRQVCLMGVTMSGRLCSP